MTEQTFTRAQYRALEKLYYITKIQRDHAQNRMNTMESKYWDSHHAHTKDKKTLAELTSRTANAEQRLEDARSALFCEHEYDHGQYHCNKCGL